MIKGKASRVTLDGINLGVSAHSLHVNGRSMPRHVLLQQSTNIWPLNCGGLPPTIVTLYDDPKIREVFPFADILRSTLDDAVQRPQTPLYNDVSLAISRTLHPMRNIQPQKDFVRLRDAIQRALNSEGLL